ncbi:ABC transporter ATP-binding protein [Mycolicibacterium mageritense DSM 44476 = CIP 104973]|uniref:ABC transporter ATP-binding protein n=1 Tax=Mycolicibacterium mageritense TaxID=53462 RepID=A0ABN5YK08_MYCME|nr:ABC transporter ATP-binding protein [Mycolicibacterium mageritense]MCC9182722.1 ABC transporter ATP-binding protein [Mycolicibacterium mageritense]BBX38306.1 ABC transporter ATP-binding protein [Mycolicibacterium mageritense]GJJ22642.1 ABC transporter ATP-binding protein [Mycolicibacterium mageritense]CDO26961.1 ABC transporter ATP-binding protein [Mycolicibacterium mageritense DSM 44476 = CIP 104973]
MTLFDVTDLAVTIHTGNRARGRRAVRAVESISFSVESGQTAAIVGESGSGKSVSLLAATRLLGARAETTGSVRFAGQDLLSVSEPELRRILGKDIGFVFQDPQSNLHPFKSVGHQIDEVLRIHTRAGRRARRERVEELLAEVGIPAGGYDSFPAEFSGGMRQRAMIAMAIALNPALIIADEPTTALDVSVQAGVLKLLKRLQREHGTAILFVSHDLGVVHEVADTVTVVKDGRVVESGSRDRIYGRPQEQYTRDLLAASLLHTVDAGRGLDAAEPADTTESLLTVRRLRKSYPARTRRERTTVVEGLDFTISPGEIVGLVGESGSGKSTVGRIVAGLQYADAGEITLAGNHFPTAVDDGVPPLPATARRDVQLVFQDPYSSLNPRRTVAASLAEPLRAQHVDSAVIVARVASAADDARLPHSLLDRYPAELSGGQRQRAAFARALVLQPRLIVADEALSSLDVTTQSEIISLVQQLVRDHRTAFLFITHDLGVVSSIAHRVIVLGPDGVEEIGATADVFSAPRSAYTRRLLDAIPRLKAS